jgi:hypothetical protein
MGTWGAGSFDNDDAADWVAELEDAAGSAFLKETLREVLDAGDSYLEGPIAARGLAAAEVVAGLRNAPGDDLPEEVEHWIEGHRSHRARAGRIEKDLTPLALQALERVRTNCELADLWKDSDAANDWTKSVTNLEERLKSE